MTGLVFKITTTLAVALGALLYQIQFPRMVSLGLGLDMTKEPLSAFPYTCRRVHHERLRACEDMWLSESTRQLFLACSEPLSREQWLPHMGAFNISGRSLTDAVAVLDVDELETGAAVDPRVLATPNFPGTSGDGRLYLVGMAGTDDDDGGIRLWLVNLRPSVDPVTGEYLDHAKVGGNSTVELFRTGREAKELKHVKTFAHPQIATPNRVAPLGGESNGFYFTNDHGTIKTGLKHMLSPLLGYGDVSFCDGTYCRQVVSGLKFPNGLAKGQDGLIYVPSSLLGFIDVYEPQSSGGLVKVHSIDAGYGLDNLSVDRDGHIFAAAFPDSIKFFGASKDPYNKDAPTTGLKIVKRAAGQYEVSKAIEDGLAEVLPGATTYIHDAKNDRLFVSGVFTPYIAICDPK